MVIDLNGIWHIDSLKVEKLPVTIPGSVLSALLDNHLIDDPYYRENEASARAWLYYDYTFTRNFSLTAENLKKQNYLFADGINTIAKLYINRVFVAKFCDMHTPKHILLDNQILKENNEIRIEFESPYRYIDQYDDQGLFATFGLTHAKSPCIRQPNFMFGWDWGPDLADMGIFRGISILSTDVGYLESFRHECAFLEDGKVRIDVETSVEKVGDGEIEAVLWLEDGEKPTHLTQSAVLQKQQRFSFIVDNPKRWNPIGFGEPTLYHLDFIITAITGEKQKAEYRIGLREVRIDDGSDDYGTNFCVYINGKKLFLKGSCYIPEDNVLSRITPERTQRLLKLVKEFNHNVVRVWGGGYYPSEDFYDYCDENGILIWQDLMFACAAYNAHDVAFRELIVEETKSNVKRFRHHASVFLISGDNECEDGVNGHGNALMEAYRTMSEDILVPLMKQLTQTYFLRTSPRSVKMFCHPNDLDHYDTHYWRVWCDDKPLSTYEKIYPRMLSEVGHQAFPMMQTIKQFSCESDLAVNSSVMQHHQKQPNSNSRIMNYVKELYGEPTYFEDAVYLSQLVQAEAMKRCAEHLRRHTERCHGMLYWQLNDCWPGISWSSVDYFYGLKALHYASRRFYAPHLVSVVDNETHSEIYVSNDTDVDQTYRLNYWNLSMDGKMSRESRLEITVCSGASLCVQRVPMGESILYVRLESPQGELLSECYHHRNTPVERCYCEPHVIIRPLTESSFEITTDVYTENVFIQSGVSEIVFSDNFFCLQPRFPKTVFANMIIPYEKLRVTTVNQLDVIKVKEIIGA
jgi:beta-mannosidase